MSRAPTTLTFPRNFGSATSLEDLQGQMGEFVSRLEDHFNQQISIVAITNKTKVRPTLKANDVVFDFTIHRGFATLQQWDGHKLIPLNLSGIAGVVNLITQGAGSGADASKFLRSDGAGHWVLDIGPVGPPGATGAAGTPGSRWFAGSSQPDPNPPIITPDSPRLGDFFLNTITGDYYETYGSEDGLMWSYKGNLRGPVGPSSIPFNATENIAAYIAVVAAGVKADSTISAHFNRVIGITDAAVTSGFIGTAVTCTELTNPGWAWSTGDKIWLNGITLSNTPPSTGFVQQLGVARSANIMIVKLGTPVLL